MTDFKNQQTAVALGTFDGLHKGHISVINKAVIQRDNGLLPVIMLFSSHPMKILTGKPPKELFSGEIKKREFLKTGCEIYKIPFEKIRNMSPEEFVRDVLKKELNASFVTCGFNFRFGRDGEGSPETLKALGEKYNIITQVANEVDFENECVSSTRIRKALGKGEAEKANCMLGRYFSYDFTVETGDKRGRLLGFPTINQFFPESFVLPKFGVYASAAYAEGRWYPAATDIGIRPTIGNSAPRSETCILGYSGNLYGTNTEVALLSYLRGEIKFNSLEDLSKQMEKDAEKAKEIFKNCDLAEK